MSRDEGDVAYGVFTAFLILFIFMIGFAIGNKWNQSEIQSCYEQKFSIEECDTIFKWNWVYKIKEGI